MIGPRDIKAEAAQARVLVVEAMARLSPRTKAYKLLTIARALLTESVDHSLNGIFKKPYNPDIR